MIFVMPPFMVPDENAHLFRAYQISTGGLLSTNQAGLTGGELPTALYQETSQLYADTINGGATSHVPILPYLKKMNLSKKKFVQFETVAVYSPFSYIPQTIGIIIGKTIYPSLFVIFYLGRLFNLFAFILMVYLAIRLAPFGKWVFFTTALLPMTMQQAASLSSDVTTIGLAFIAVAYFLHLLAANRLLTRRQVLLIFGLGVLLGFTKQTNPIFMIPYLFFPAKFFVNSRKRILFCFGALVSAFGAALLWYLIIKLLHYNLNYSGNAAVNMSQQERHLLRHPVSYLAVLFRTFIFNGTSTPPTPDFYWQSMVGVFSWIRYSLPIMSVIAAYIILLLSLLISTSAKLTSLISRRIRLSFGFVLIGSMLAISTILYVIWTPVGAPVVAGIQGRYFLPLVPLLIPIVSSQKLRLVASSKTFIPACITLVTAANFLMMFYETMRYFHHWA